MVRIAPVTKAAPMTTEDHSSTVPDVPQPGPVDLGLDAVDHDAVLHALAERLSSVPGLQVDIERSRSRVSRVVGDFPFANDHHREADPIRRMTVTVGPVAYWVEPTSGAPLCAVETVTVDRGRTSAYNQLPEWTDLLVDDVARHRHLDPNAAAALRDRIHGGRA
jgi:hypothetical protein